MAGQMGTFPPQRPRHQGGKPSAPIIPQIPRPGGGGFSALGRNAPGMRATLPQPMQHAPRTPRAPGTPQQISPGLPAPASPINGSPIRAPRAPVPQTRIRAPRAPVPQTRGQVLPIRSSGRGGLEQQALAQRVARMRALMTAQSFG